MNKAMIPRLGTSLFLLIGMSHSFLRRKALYLVASLMLIMGTL